MVSVGVLASVVACGGSTDDGLSGSGGTGNIGGSSGTGAASGAGGSAGAAGGPQRGRPAGSRSDRRRGRRRRLGGSSSGGSAGYTLENVCQKTQPQGCEWAKDCCTTSGFGYDKSGCEKRALGDCEKSVAEVKAGKMSFDPTKVDACLAAYKKLLSQCTVGVNDLYLALDELKACSYAFQGKVPTGSSCDRDADCAPSADPNVFVGCDDAAKGAARPQAASARADAAIGDQIAGFIAARLYCEMRRGPAPPPSPASARPATPSARSATASSPTTWSAAPASTATRAPASVPQPRPGGPAAPRPSSARAMPAISASATPSSP